MSSGAGAISGTADYDWLREIARDSPIGKAHRWMRELFLPEILVHEGDLQTEETKHTLGGVDTFVHWALHEARLVPGEFPQEALWCNEVDRYLGEVNNGGHGQYVGNTGWNPYMVGACERGLRAIGADDYGTIFAEFKTHIESDAPRAAAIADRGGFGETDPVLKDLDKRLYALKGTERVVRAAGAWLRTLPSMRGFPGQELVARKENIERSNELRQRRLGEAEAFAKRLETERIAAHPALSILTKLCRSTGLKLVGIASFGGPFALSIFGIRIEASHGYKLGIETNRGHYDVFFLRRYGAFGQPAAVLGKLMARAPIKSVGISLADYERIVPDYIREGLDRD